MTQTRFEQGDLLLATYPFTDRSFAKLRPVVVISRREFNRAGDIVVLPLSSNLRGSDYEIEIGTDHPDWARTRLKRPSAVKWSKPMTIAVSVVAGRLGTLPDDVMQLVVQSLRQMIEPSAPLFDQSDP